MDNVTTRPQNPILRQLANLKILSRLLAHEVHSQNASKTLTLSRDEVSEIQTALELYIEDVSRRYSQAPSAGGVASVESPLVGVRN
jgi:glutamine synthetase adenylyltransferase